MLEITKGELDAKESGNIDILSLKIYKTQLDKLISEAKEKNL